MLSDILVSDLAIFFLNPGKTDLIPSPFVPFEFCQAILIYIFFNCTVKPEINCLLFYNPNLLSITWFLTCGNFLINSCLLYGFL